MVEREVMIRKLVVEGITVFPQKVSFDFVSGINVIVGGNDSGKSHLMKLSYALSKWSEKSPRREFPETWAEEERLRRYLLHAFGTQELSAIASRHAHAGEARVHASLQGEKAPLGSAEVSFSFSPGREEEGLSIATMPQRFLQEGSLFIPPREVLSLFPCYMQVGKRYPDLLDATCRDLCQALETPPGQVEIAPEMRAVLRLIETLLHGKLTRHNARFLLQRGKQAPMELSLVAEGFKRLGTLGLLLANGALRPGTTLFWDEPEMNLNATHLPLLCRIMLGLCQAGVQLMLTTHSLFLLRELVICLNQPSMSGVLRRFIGLQPPPSPNSAVRVSAGNSLDEISPLESLDAEMEQADRYLRMPNLPYSG